MCGASLILLPLILSLFCLTGCIQEDSALKETSPGRIEEASPVRMEINFDPEVSGRLFRVKGSLALSGGRPLPYLLLNATLLKDGRPLCSTKYMMIEVEPGKDYSFEISKNLRIWPGGYSCILDVLGPEGQMASEVRECRIMEPFLAESALIPELSSAKEKPYVAEEQPEALGDLKRKLKPKVHEEKDEPNEIRESPEEQVAEASKSGSKALQNGDLVGSTTSNKYHRPDCRYAAKIRPENRAYFEDEGEAKKQGYSPCKTCNP
jgi:hypothetical protein